MYLQKINKLTNSRGVIAMSEQVKTELEALTERLVSLKKLVSDLNHSDESDIEEMKKILKENHNYQKVAEQLLEFLKMTTRGSEWFEGQK